MPNETIKSFIQFVDGTVLPTLAVYSTQEYFQGAKRNVFEIRMPDDEVTFDQIRHVVDTEGNTELLILIERHYNENNEVVQEFKFEHGFYNLVMDSGLKYFEDFGNAFVLKLAQLTKEEQNAWVIDQDIDEQGAAIVELAEIISEG